MFLLLGSNIATSFSSFTGASIHLLSLTLGLTLSLRSLAVDPKSLSTEKPPTPKSEQEIKIEEANSFPNASPSPQSNFHPFTENHFARILIDFPIYSFYLGAPDINGVAYVPNFTPRLGAQYLFKELGASLSLALPLPSEEIERRGNSDQLDFQLNKHWQSQGFDSFYQSYRGFYIASPWTEFRSDKPTRYPKIPDAEIIHYGINYYKVVQPERYSLKAAFSQMEIQKKSGGSFIYSLFYDHLEMDRGQKFEPGTESSANNRFPSIKSARLDTLGTTLGYGYTFIYDSFQISLQITGGPGLQIQKYQEEGFPLSENAFLALKGNVNGGISYKYKGHYFGGKFLLDTLVSNVRNTQVYSSLVSGTIYYGNRF